ncbi:hypothetical protein GCM10009765_81560 [Fodinicola feengrottensis]|uniref:NAD-dependent epimerase/dehydratase domain-containing protein n=1 Tax=Fodinicola feengrottensis TaxID=435914 RepID=A0ABN2J9Z7_9ACTN
MTVLSRSERDPYQPHGAWDRVRTVTVDRVESDAAGEFGPLVAELEPDVVIDLISYTQDSAGQLVEALRGRVQHFLHCGTIWVHGHSAAVPTTEDAPRRPFGDYGIGKAAVERYLLDQARRYDFPATLVHPGHISGPGWVPINPAGHLDLGVFQALADGKQLALPNLGMETLQHVHASDVADTFLAAMANRSVSIGESFHSVASGALTLRGYAEAVAGWFGREADLTFLPWEQWTRTASADAAKLTHDHLAHSPHCSMEKADRLLGFRPRFSVLETLEEAVNALVASGRIVR